MVTPQLGFFFFCFFSSLVLSWVFRFANLQFYFFFTNFNSWRRRPPLQQVQRDRRPHQHTTWPTVDDSTPCNTSVSSFSVFRFPFTYFPFPFHSFMNPKTTAIRRCHPWTLGLGCVSAGRPHRGCLAWLQRMNEHPSSYITTNPTYSWCSPESDRPSYSPSSGGRTKPSLTCRLLARLPTHETHACCRCTHPRRTRFVVPCQPRRASSGADITAWSAHQAASMDTTPAAMLAVWGGDARRRGGGW